MKHKDYMRELLKMSDEAIMRVLSSKVFHRDLAQKYIDGAEFVDHYYRPIGSPYFVESRGFYIEKPKTIKITFEVSRPLSVSGPCAPNYISAANAYAYISGKAINFRSTEDCNAFSENLLKAVEEAMQQ